MVPVMRHSLLTVSSPSLPHPMSTDGDTLMFINFRADRARQISEALGITRHFDTECVPHNLVRGG